MSKMSDINLKMQLIKETSGEISLKFTAEKPIQLIAITELLINGILSVQLVMPTEYIKGLDRKLQASLSKISAELHEML